MVNQDQKKTCRSMHVQNHSPIISYTFMNIPLFSVPLTSKSTHWPSLTGQFWVEHMNLPGSMDMIRPPPWTRFSGSLQDQHPDANAVRCKLALAVAFVEDLTMPFELHIELETWQKKNIWVNYNELTTSSLEIMVSKGNHPQMALIQVSELL